MKQTWKENSLPIRKWEFYISGLARNMFCHPTWCQLISHFSNDFQNGFAELDISSTEASCTQKTRRHLSANILHKKLRTMRNRKTRDWRALDAFKAVKIVKVNYELTFKEIFQENCLLCAWSRVFWTMKLTLQCIVFVTDIRVSYKRWAEKKEYCVSLELCDLVDVKKKFCI